MTLLIKLIYSNSSITRVLGDMATGSWQDGIRKDADRWERSMTCYRHEGGKQRSS